MSTSYQIAYPFQFDGRGRTAQTTNDTHVRDMIEQVLFTTPGERVNRPTFGSGILQLVFAPNSPEVATATQFMAQGALQQWLGDLIKVNSLQVDSQDSTLLVTVQYTLLSTRQTQIVQITRSV